MRQDEQKGGGRERKTAKECNKKMLAGDLGALNKYFLSWQLFIRP